MHILDVNLLLYAFREEFPEHRGARAWLEDTLRTQSVGLPVLSEVAFLRLSTRPLGPLKPASWPAAWAFLAALLTHPKASRIQPGVGHTALLNQLMVGGRLTYKDIPDAWLAALALELDATLESADRGFARFPGLKWHNPIA